MRKSLGKFMLAAAILPALVACATPVAAEDSQQEQANKQLVLAFYDALGDADADGAMADRIAGIAQTYLHPDYTQRAGMFVGLPGEGRDRDKLIALFRSLPRSGTPMPRATTVSIMAERDLVMLLTKRERTDPATGQVSDAFTFNMFRVRDGQLIEHWDGSPAGGPPPGGAMGPPPGGAMGPPPGSH